MTGPAPRGLTGVAVILSTHPMLGTNSDNFVSIVTSSPSGLAAIATRVPVGQLRTGIHTLEVTLAAGGSSCTSMAAW